MGFVKDMAKLLGEKTRMKRTADQESQLDARSKQILDAVRSKANEGDGYAMYTLGGYYIKATYVGYDPRQACYWWTEAANRGNVDAQYNLGLLYHGNVSAMYYDENLAGYWFNEAANNGDAEAENMLRQYKYGAIRRKWSKI